MTTAASQLKARGRILAAETGERSMLRFPHPSKNAGSKHLGVMAAELKNCPPAPLG